MQNPSIFKPASRPVFSVDYSDLESFVTEKYGTPFEITEVDNDSDIACNTDMKYFNETDIADVRERIAKGDCPGWHVDTVIKLLFKDGHIVDGDYIVNVCW